MLSHLKMKPEVEEPKRQSSGSRILERRPLLLQLCLKRNVNVYLFIFLFARGLSTCLVTPHPIMQVPNGRNTSFVLQEPCRMPPWWKELFSQRGTNRVVNVWQKENTIKQQIRVWHSWKFWYEWMSEYIRINKITRMNIRIYSYKFFWHEQMSE